ncbi:MAG: hypothetical protein CVU39_06790 [Chloroflexi bacterium HGW-Chloroflexi-10]|nr:MAG: hypothetical protein CVU39_06790 [Chloroflexi bacterium HGW-Chloroflexi-10]
MNGLKYVYSILSNIRVHANATQWITKHEEKDWITFITCQQNDEKSKSYRYRRVVRAVLIKVVEE